MSLGPVSHKGSLTGNAGWILGCVLLPAAEPLGQFDPRPLFWQVRGSLLELLPTLGPDQWQAPTAAQPWLVRDVVAHLVGDDLGRLSRSRDSHPSELPARGESLPQFLDRHNAEWVAAAQRLSSRTLTELLTMTSEHIRSFWDAADLAAIGEPVSWAGPEPAPVWLDCARDFTEDWVHQEQVRRALHLPATTDGPMLGAVLDTFMHAIPRTLQQHAPAGAAGRTINIVLHDQDGTADWTWVDRGKCWTPTARPATPTATISCSADTWWRLCVRMITPEQARARCRSAGDPQLLTAALQIIAIIRDA